MANVLIVHQNFPGQFLHLARALLARGDRVFALGGSGAVGLDEIPIGRWAAKRGTTPDVFEPATRAEADIVRGHHALRVAAEVDRRGFSPDVIVGHPGWGETLFLNELWPKAPTVLLGESLYLGRGGDSGFDPEFDSPDLWRAARAHAKNATQVLAHAYANRIICPTHFQASTFPESLQHLIRIVHEGVDVSAAQRRTNAHVRLPSGKVLSGNQPVITHVNRALEPMRGLHILLRSLPAFLDACPAAEVVIVGEEASGGYGLPPSEGQTWSQRFLEELGDRLDRSRVHFIGKVDHSTLIDVLSVSWAHVYYTYPFVLSWSVLEAMSCECLIIGSDTAPVRDAITNGEEGILLPFFDVRALTETLIRVVQDREDFAPLRTKARARAVESFDAKRGTDDWLKVIDEFLV